MDISLFSKAYEVRQLSVLDVDGIVSLCSKNELYYRYCPPFVTKESILEDMRALPPGKEYPDKYYVGYFNGENLVAVMDLIMKYPDEKTAFIGFFMVDYFVQNTGIGSKLIGELCSYLPSVGMSYIRLCWVEGNPQAEHFWHKNGFGETGVKCDMGQYTVIVAQREL